MSIRARLRPWVMGALAVLPGLLALAAVTDRLFGRPLGRWTDGLAHPEVLAWSLVAAGVILVSLLIFVSTGPEAKARRAARRAARRKLTKADREIWFEPWAGGWQPVSWKGYGLLGLMIAYLMSIALWFRPLQEMGGDLAVQLALPVFLLVGFGGMTWLVKRHCAPARDDD